MSWQAQAWVWTLDIPAPDKLIALFMANAANEFGENIWPSVPTVAANTALSVASVKRGIARLKEAGLLIQTHESTGKKGETNRYRMPVDLDAVAKFHRERGGQRTIKKGDHAEPPKPQGGVTETPRGGSNDGLGGVHSELQTLDITLDKNPRVLPELDENGEDEFGIVWTKPAPKAPPPSPPKSEFDVFWKAYPRKIGKPLALKAWPKAVEKAGSAAAIMTALARARLNDHRFRDLKFTPHPTSWLHSDPWEDDFSSPAAPQPPNRPKHIFVEGGR